MSSLKVDIKVMAGSFAGEYKFALEAGIHGVYGPSGNGKTTLFNAVAGLLNPTEGTVSVGERVLFSSVLNQNIPVHHRKVGFCFQGYRLFPHLSVAKNIVASKGGSTKKPLFNELVGLLGLEPLLSKNVLQCSGGEQQRVAIARALFICPDVLLLDEPFAALDPQNRAKVIALLHKIAQRFTIPILVISHQLDDIQLLTDSILMINAGKVAYCGSLSTYVFSNGPHPTVLSKYKNVLRFSLKPAEVAHYYYALNHTLNLRFLVERAGLYETESLTAMLPPSEIVLSIHPLQGVSARNQIKATVVKLYTEGARTWCVADAGELVVSEITTTAAVELNLKPGDTVWCIFKSVVLEFN